MPPLKNLRHEQFVQLYFADPEKNAPRAYANAGFNVKTLKEKSTSASASANRILKDVKVQKRLAELQERLQRRLDVNADRVFNELVRIGLSDARKVIGRDGCILDPEQWDDETAAAVSSFRSEKLFEGKGTERKQIGYTQEIKLWDKNTALNALAKHFKLLGDGNTEGNTYNTQYNFYLPTNSRDPKETLTHAPSNGNGSGNGHT